MRAIVSKPATLKAQRKKVGVFTKRVAQQMLDISSTSLTTAIIALHSCFLSFAHINLPLHVGPGITFSTDGRPCSLVSLGLPGETMFHVTLAWTGNTVLSHLSLLFCRGLSRAVGMPMFLI
jgi:hypothetical protein